MGDAIGIILFFVFALTLLTGGAPLLILAAWLEERGRTKRILAEARLQEAKNAARQSPSPPHGGDQ